MVATARAKARARARASPSLWAIVWHCAAKLFLVFLCVCVCFDTERKGNRFPHSVGTDLRPEDGSKGKRLVDNHCAATTATTAAEI